MDIRDYLNDDELYNLGLYLKRICYEDVYERVEGFEAERKENACKTLDVIEKLETYLRDMGFDPR